MSAVLRECVAPSVFSMQDGEALSRWIERKLAQRPRRAAELVVEVRDPRNLTRPEHEALVERCRRSNMAIYASRANGDPAAMLQRVAWQLGLRTPDVPFLTAKSGVARIAVDARKAAGGFIPYTSRRMLWHTDGYYNAPARPVRSMLLHCVRDAPMGGETALLDPELAWLMLLEAGPQFVRALMEPDALAIPPRADLEGVARPASVGPVFRVEPGSGDLHTRYTARRRNVQWRRDAVTAEAAARLISIMDRDDACVLRTRLEPGMGLVCNNVLHERGSFEEEPGRTRLLLRARYLERIAGTEGAWMRWAAP
jgi:hypothetical protein